MWLEEIYQLCEENNTDKGIDILFSKIDELLLKEDFDLCDDLLRTINLQKLNTSMLLGLLSITFTATAKLPYRSKLVTNIEAVLKVREPNRVESLLKGLC